MYKILLLFLISMFCTTVAIYADCDLPTGGACKIEDLKKKQEASKTQLEDYDIIKKLDKQNISEQDKILPQDEYNVPRQKSLKSLFED